MPCRTVRCETVRDVSADQRQAAAAALVVAGQFGLGGKAPIVLAQSNNVVAWLAPSSVVVKVGVGHHGRLAQELRVGAYLAGLGAPVVGPAPEIPARVHAHDGFAMTFWRYQPSSRVELHNNSVAAALHELHAGLARYVADTRAAPPSYRQELVLAAAAIAEEGAAPGLVAEDRSLLGDVLTRTAMLDERPERAIHGSPHDSNIISIDGGALFIDFETVAVGPIEWDLAHLADEVAAAYPAPIDPATLASCRTLVSAKTAAWCWAGAARSPELRWHAEHHLAVVKRATC
jgi:phosphotransferase family enzyme